MNRKDPVYNWSNTYVFSLIRASTQVKPRAMCNNYITFLLEPTNVKAFALQDSLEPRCNRAFHWSHWTGLRIISLSYPTGTDK